MFYALLAAAALALGAFGYLGPREAAEIAGLAVMTGGIFVLLLSLEPLRLFWKRFLATLLACGLLVGVLITGIEAATRGIEL